MIINNFIYPLVLTIIIECLIALILGYRTKTFFLAVVIVNLVTNPFLNYIIILLGYFKLTEMYLQVVIALEIIIVFAEWRIYYYIYLSKKRQLFLLSIATNLASYTIGLLIYN